MRDRDLIVTVVSATFLIAFVAFGYGAAVGRYELWPFDLISQMKEVVISFVSTGSVYPKNLVVAPPGGPTQQRIQIPSGASPLEGFRAIMGYDSRSGAFSVWLFDEKGNELHRWPINYDAIVNQEGDGVTDRGDQPHGLDVRPDGSIVVNFDQANAMARLDQCGKPIWVTEGIFHHSLNRTENGKYWTWGGIKSSYDTGQHLVKFDAETGKVIESIDLVEDILKSSEVASTVFSVPRNFDYEEFNARPEEETDIFHTNDIEELTSTMSPAFPGLEAGDLLISLRNLHLVAVIRPSDRSVIWARHGPWRFQHDPDFNADGTISVYDNNTDVGVSSIIKVTPSEPFGRKLYTDGNLRFFSGSMGKHQMLPGGGALIVVPGEGRVLEVDSNGNLTFEFNNRIKPELNGHVQNGIWLPPGYFTALPACSEG